LRRRALIAPFSLATASSSRVISGFGPLIEDYSCSGETGDSLAKEYEHARGMLLGVSTTIPRFNDLIKPREQGMEWRGGREGDTGRRPEGEIEDPSTARTGLP